MSSTLVSSRLHWHSCLGELEAAWAWEAVCFCLDYLHMGGLGQGVRGDYEGAWHPTPFGVPSSPHLPAKNPLFESVYPTKWPVRVPHYLPPKGHLSFISFLSWKSLPRGALQRRENQHKTGHQNSGDMNLKLHHPSLISASPSPAEPGEKCGTSLW